MKLCAAYKVFNAELYLPYSIRAIYDYVDHIVIFLSTRPWNGPAVPTDGTEKIIREFPDPAKKITLVVKDFRRKEIPGDGKGNELVEMNEMLNFIRQNLPTMTHYFYVDWDEMYNPESLVFLRQFLSNHPPDCEFRALWRCYWKSFRYWIDPPEPSRPLIAFGITPRVRFTTCRDTTHQNRVVLPESHFMIHHLSYALPSTKVLEKIKSWTHCYEVYSEWFENVWLGWDKNREMENLHPVNPSEYRRAVLADAATLPRVLRDHPLFEKDIM